MLRQLNTEDKNHKLKTKMKLIVFHSSAGEASVVPSSQAASSTFHTSTVTAGKLNSSAKI